MSDGSFPTPISKNDDLNSQSNPLFSAVSKDGNPNAVGNPIYVQEVGTPAVTSTPVHNYAPNNLASNASFNQDYTVVGTKFKLKRVVCASTGQAKFEIQVGPSASLVSKAVVMVGPNCRTGEVVFDPPLEVPVTGAGKVRVIQKNLQTGTNDVYSTIMGEDVA